ncbi:MucBP domain-containing protein [Lactococcus garvieae]|uniref:MucBP domain-containing protein n=1 Tax=Lactococcus garvieae TaxID=1363 RepID=UPI002550F8DF|nr:MucBP domain-containing protein [Lactococcus garvieae]
MKSKKLTKLGGYVLLSSIFVNGLVFASESDKNSQVPTSKINQQELQEKMPSSNIMTWQWETISIQLDITTGILRIPSGTLTNPPSLGSILEASNNNGLNFIPSVTKIIIEGPLDLNGSVASMFARLTSLISIDGMNNLDTTDVTTMNGMFAENRALTSIDVSNFNTSKVTDMQTMFYEVGVTRLDLSSFDTKNVSNMTMMFGGGAIINELKLGKNFKFLSSNPMEPGLDLGWTNFQFPYTGKWRNVGSGTVELPLGNNVWDTDSLVQNYQPLRDADTYVWDRWRVTVKYVDENNNSIAEDVVLVADTDHQYHTEQKDIPGYTFKEVQGKTSGDFALQPQDVIYKYTKNPVVGGDVTVKYVDENNNPIIKNTVLSGNVGEHYDTEQKDIPGYTFKEVQGKPSGEFVAQEQTVTYKYAKDPVLGGNVTVKYVDENNSPILQDIVFSGNIGEHYVTEQKEIPNYVFEKVEGQQEGTYKDKPQEVIYIYKKVNVDIPSMPVKDGKVIVKYVDDFGNNVLDYDVMIGKIGEHYITEQKDISGYNFEKVEGQSKGCYKPTVQVVTYIYKKVSDDTTTDKLGTINEGKKKVEDKHHHTLPLTGEQSSIIVTVLGMISLVLLMIVVSVKKLMK